MKKLLTILGSCIFFMYAINSLAFEADGTWHTINVKANQSKQISYTVDQMDLQYRFYRSMACRMEVMNGKLPITDNEADLYLTGMNYTPASGIPAKDFGEYFVQGTLSLSFAENNSTVEKKKNYSFFSFIFRGTPKNPEPIVRMKCTLYN